MTRARQANPDAFLFGAILRRERVARNWTIRKLAQRAGVNAQYLGVVETGGNIPTLSLILEVAEVLGADAGEMVREVALARKPKREIVSVKTNTGSERHDLDPDDQLS